MAKKLVRKALEMLRKLADGDKEGEEEDSSKTAKVSVDGAHPYIKFWEQVRHLAIIMRSMLIKRAIIDTDTDDSCVPLPCVLSSASP